MTEASNVIFEYDEWKCSWCKNLLSVSPILMVGGEEIFCGRCKDIIREKNSNPKIERQVIYEQLAKSGQFPCQYKDEGCEKILGWKEVKKHEENCKYREMECLFNWKEFKERNGCRWTGDHRDFFKHLDENHPLPVHPVNKLEIWKKAKSQLFKIYCMNDTFLLVLLYVDNIYYSMLIGDNRKRSIKYKIEILDESRQKSFIYSYFSKFLPNNTNQIKEIGTKLEYHDIIPKYLTVFFGDISECQMAECNAKILSRCEICKEPMTLPAYSCTSAASHAICKYCYKNTRRCLAKGQFCIHCYADLERNDELEMKYSEEHFRCHFHSCFFHGNIIEIDLHYRVCKCFCLKSTRLLEFNFFYEICTSQPQFEFDNTLFTLLVDFEDDLTFQLLSHRITKIEYKFEITVKNYLSTEIIFPIMPNFYAYRSNKVLNADYFVQIPKTLIDQDNTGHLIYKLNVSK